MTSAPLDIGFQAASSHAALTRLLALQTELDASTVENVRLVAALSESRLATTFGSDHNG